MQNDLWYAVKVRPRAEWMTAENLRAKGYELFLPSYTSKRRWSDRMKTLEMPLFPGYLFCQFDISKRLPVLMTPGVSFVVGAGKIPEPVSETEIEAIRTVVKSGLAFEPFPYLTVGQMVEVEQGSLAGLVGLITEVRNETRLIISVNLLMRSVSVEIDRTWVEPVRQTGRAPFYAPVPAMSRAAAVRR